MWKQNPAVLHGPPDLPIGWVIEADQGIVGHVASIPVQYAFGDRVLTVAVGSAFRVAVPFRHYSLALFEAFVKQRQVDMVIGTTVNTPSAKMWRFYKGEAFPSGPFSRAMPWLIDPYKFLNSFFIHPKYSPFRTLGIASGLLARIASVTFYGPLCLEIALRKRTPRGPREGLLLTMMDPAEIGSDFDCLWSRKIQEGEGKLMVTRTSEALRWRFGRPGGNPI